MSYGEPMNVQAIRPLELLHRTASYLGAVLVLTTDRDKRAPGAGRRVNTRVSGAQLRRLLVVVPHRNRDELRWVRLQQGTTIASVDLHEAVPLDDAASLLVEELQARIAEAARRNAA